MGREERRKVEIPRIKMEQIIFHEHMMNMSKKPTVMYNCNELIKALKKSTLFNFNVLV